MGKPSVSKAEIGLVLYPGCQMAMVQGMTDLFEVAGRISLEHGGARLRIAHWRIADGGRMTRCFDTHPEQPGAPDIVIVPGHLTTPIGPEEAAAYATWLLEQHARGAILSSTCAGSFMLAATGLLAGRPTTTHWRFAEAFRARFPDVPVNPDRMIIDDGDVITAGGMMAWTDLGIRLIGRFLGPTVMMETAKFMLIDPSGREQRHYSDFVPRLSHGDEAILKVQHWLQTNGARDVSVTSMAAQARLEERTFQRRFKAATGLKPIEYVQNLRVAKARELLEFTRRPVDQVAWAVGYEDPAAFRRVFQRYLGLSPGEYRSRFSAATEESAAA